MSGHTIRWNNDIAELPGDESDRLLKLTNRSAKPGFTMIVQNFANRLERDPRAGIMIGRTMFETDRLPPEGVEACNRMDYIWVPTEFNRTTFADAGVAPEKLVVVPCCLDAGEFESPAEPTPLVIELRSGCTYVFLAVFDWTLHKGWDLLLRAFLAAFPPGSGVRLVLKVWSTNGYSNEQILAQAAELVQSEFGIELEADDRVRFVFDRLSRPDLLALYSGCNAYVLPSRGEGFGRPYMEAMACGKPTIGTNWGGNTAFMNAENSYLVECSVVPAPETGWREIPPYKGHRWAEPNVDSLKAAMRSVVNSPAEAAARGALARTEILSKYSRASVGKQMVAELARVESISRKAAETQTNSEEIAHKGTKAQRGKARQQAVPQSKIESRKSQIRWEGALFSRHSLAQVNCDITRRIIDLGCEVSLIPTEAAQFDPARFPETQGLAGRVFAPLSQAADVHVRHFFPPRFDRPDQGKLVLIQPWEYGYLPTHWVDPILQNVSEVWCYSEYVRQVYIASGIPAERTQVVPLGVDTTVFRPEAPPYVFTTEAGAADLQVPVSNRFVFLFVGGTLHRKGIDILLEAYQKAFSAYDDVCLVIKDTGTQTVYRGQNERERILALAADRTRPAIIYLEDDLSAAQLAGLYTASHCVVLPYRCEGFCLPAGEAISSGVPVIVPMGGPTDDFIDEEAGWRITAVRLPYGNSRIGEWPCCGPTWGLEVHPEVLGRQMRSVFGQREEAKRRGAAGRKRAVDGWTWDHTSAKVLERLAALREMADIAPPEVKQALAPALPIAPARPRLKGVVVRPARVSPAATDRRSGARAGAPSHRIPKLSLCMIVKQEERCLDACLTSIAPHVDEIIVVDTGSTDRTVEIAKSHGARVFHTPWEDNFAKARNVSLEHATGDWCLWMDADDTIASECGEQLRNVILRAESTTAAFIMQVHIPPAPGEYGFTVVDHVKLVRRDPRIRFTGRIHEQLLQSVRDMGGEIERTNLYVIHSSYDTSPEGQKRKLERDFRILKLEVEEHPDEPFPRFNVAMSHHHSGGFAEALPWLEQALERSKPHESTVRKIYAFMGSCHLRLGDPVRSRERIEEGLALTPRDPELLFRAAETYRTLNDFASSERCYLTLINNPESGHIDSIDVSLTTYKAYHNFAMLYQDMQRWGDAEALFKQAVAAEPKFMPSWEGLFQLYMRMGRKPEALAAADRIAEWAPDAAARMRQIVGFNDAN